MRFCSILLPLFLTASVPAAEAPDAPPLFSLDYVGNRALAKNKNAGALNELLGLDAGRALKQETIRKLKFAYQTALSGRAVSGPELPAMTFLEELFEHPVRLSVNDEGGGRISWLVGARVPESRQAKWLADLTNSVASAGAGPLVRSKRNRVTEWVVRKNGESRAWVILQVNDWIIFGTGDDSRVAAFGVGLLREGLNGANAVGEIRGSLDAAVRLLGLPEIGESAWVDLQMTIKGGRLRTEGAIRFARPLPLKLDPFQLPENSVRDPLISFAAVRGVAGWLSRFPVTRDLRWKEVPNQAVFWSQSTIPYQTFLAAPQPAAAALIQKLAPRALEIVGAELTAAGMGRLHYTTNRNELGWLGLPILVPFLRPAPETNGNWLLGGTMAGLIPEGKNTNPPPVELTGQIMNRPDLVYYGWEITQPRLEQWRGISQLMLMATPNPFLISTSKGQLWLKAIEPRLGNTVTEVVRSAPDTLRIVRSSHLGLTAAELVLFARWLDNPDFPALRYPKLVPGLAPPSPLPGK